MPPKKKEKKKETNNAIKSERGLEGFRSFVVLATQPILYRRLHPPTM